VIEVLLVEDHPIFVDGLRAAIDGHRDMRVTGVARNLREAREHLARSMPTIAVVDVRLPDGSGFDLIDRSLPTRWLLLSSFGTAQYVEATLHQGAHGYFLKTTPPDGILDAIATIVTGGTAFDPTLMARRSVAGTWSPFSERERGVLRHLLDGATNDEIGARLGIGRKTVESHLERLRERMGCVSRTELASRCVEEGWLDLPHR
jgi:DNA-binding NarL/FixJ family response regulator